MRSSNGVDLPGRESHQDVEPQTEKLRRRDATGHPAAKLLLADPPVSHRMRLALVAATVETQPNMVADLEAAKLETVLGCLPIIAVALYGQSRLFTSCAAERLANLELTTDTGALGVNGAPTAKTHSTLQRHTGRSPSRSGVGTASEVRFTQSALHDCQTHASKTLGLLAVEVDVGGAVDRPLLHTACAAQLTIILRPIPQGTYSAGLHDSDDESRRSREWDI